MLLDSCQRRLTYLRLSLTELCNIRCEYCLPAEGLFRIHREDLLSFSEIERLVSILVPLGICRVRLTGGEPLLRKELPSLVRALVRMEGLEEVLLTTNGLRLAETADALVAAGLRRLNVHLDTLDPDRYAAITRGGDVRKVLAGIHAAQKAGLSPIKINAVVQKGVNDTSLGDMLRLCAREGWILRLIEMMPIGPGRLLGHRFVSLGDIRERLAREWTFETASGVPGQGPARYERIVELDSLIGFIRPVSEPFCDSCNRIRISSDGRFQDCLAYDGRFSFRDLLRNPALSDADIGREVRQVLYAKRESHDGFLKNNEATPCMSGIGG